MGMGGADTPKGTVPLLTVAVRKALLGLENQVCSPLEHRPRLMPRLSGELLSTTLWVPGDSLRAPGLGVRVTTDFSFCFVGNEVGFGSCDLTNIRRRRGRISRLTT
jgi:hypothetical protein